MRTAGTYLLVNSALALVVTLTAQSLIPRDSDLELYRRATARWLPWSLFVAAALNSVVAWRTPSYIPMLRASYAMWLAAPLTIALAAIAPGAGLAWYAAPFVGALSLAGAWLVRGLWTTRTTRTDGETGRLFGVSVFAIAVALLPYEAGAMVPTADEPHYLVAMQSLVRDGDLDVRNQYDNGQYHEFLFEELPDRHVIDVGAAQYPIHDLGYVFLGAIPFAIAGRAGVMLLSCVVIGAFAWRLHALVRLLGFDPTAAFVAASFAFVHPLITYTTQIYPDVPALLVVLLVAELLARAPTAPRLAASSALIGIMPWLSARLWPAVIGLGLVVAWIALVGLAQRRLAAVPLVVAGALPFAALVAAYAALDFMLYGVPLPNAGYLIVRDQAVVLTWSPYRGIPGLFLDRTFGLLPHAPLYALAFVGVAPLARLIWSTRSPALIALALAWAFSLVYVGSIRVWWADWSPASRYLLSTLSLPLAAVAAGTALQRRPALRLFAWAAAIWSIAVAALLAAAPLLRYDLADNVAPTSGLGSLWAAVYAATGIDFGRFFPSIVRSEGSDLALTAIWVLALVAFVVVGAGPRVRPTAPTH